MENERNTPDISSISLETNLVSTYSSGEIFAGGHWLVNNSVTLVNDGLQGYVKCNPELALLDYGRVVIQRNFLELDKVKIMSGGASGHEPAFAGFVGQGFLSAAVQGDIFQPPSVDRIFKTIKQLARRNPHGILVIIQNNTLDRLSFGLGVERANNIDNLECRIICVNDEIRPDTEKQGFVGTILIQKIAGAMSEQGFFLDEIYNFCMDRLAELASLTVSFSVAETPYLKVSSCARYMKRRSMEFGAGFHGEPGYMRTEMKSTSETVKMMLDDLFNVDYPGSIGFSETSSEESTVVVIINNLGICYKLEELLFLKEVVDQLQEKKLKIAKLYCGSFLTSLRMTGFSLTIMKVTDPKVLDYLDYPCSCIAWNEFSKGEMSPDMEIYLDTTFKKEELRPKTRKGPEVDNRIADIIMTSVRFACEALTSCEKQLNLMDAETGDADTGTNIRTAVTAIEKELDPKLANNPHSFFKELSVILEKTSHGLSGLMYAIMFEACAKPFAELPEKTELDVKIWLSVFEAAVTAVEEHGKVRPGNMSMLDPLQAALNTFLDKLDMHENTLNALEEAVQVAEDTAEQTKAHRKHQDPGAHATAICLRSIYEAVNMMLA